MYPRIIRNSILTRILNCLKEDERIKLNLDYDDASLYFDFMLRLPTPLIKNLLSLSKTEINLFFKALLFAQEQKKEVIEIPVSQLMEKRGGGSQYRLLKVNLKKLLSRVIEIKIKGGTKLFHLVSSALLCEYNVKIKLSDELNNIIQSQHQRKSCGYVSLRIKSILDLKYFYSVKLYMLFCNNLNSKSFLIYSGREIRNIIDCSLKYKRQRALIDVIDRAVYEINKKTELKIVKKETFTKNKLVSMRFYVLKKENVIDLTDFLDTETARDIENNYPPEYVRECLILTNKNHKEEKGTKAGYFLTLTENNFDAWRVKKKKLFAQYLKTFERPKKPQIEKKKDQIDPSKVPAYARHLLKMVM